MKQKLRVSRPLPWISKRSRSGRLLLCRGVQAQRELRDHVLPSHVGTVDIVRTEDQHALEDICGRN